MPRYKNIFRITLLCIFFLLFCSTYVCAQTKLSPAEKKRLEKMDKQSKAEEVASGTYTTTSYIASTVLQVTVLLLTLGLLAYGTRKLAPKIYTFLASFLNYQEKRRWKRIKVTTKQAAANITGISEKAPLQAHLLDISKGGACLELEDAPEGLQTGQNLEMQLQVRDKNEVIIPDLTCNVRWIKDNKVGIQFSNLLQYSQDVLEGLFSSPSRAGAKA